MRHDSHIRSDWLQIGTTRANATRLADAIERRISEVGDDFNARMREHSGRRDDACDRVSPTAPGGWKEQHGGRETVKIRGCDHFRAEAKRIAADLIAGGILETRHDSQSEQTITVDGVELYSWPERGGWYQVGTKGEIGTLYLPMMADGTPASDELVEISEPWEDDPCPRCGGTNKHGAHNAGCEDGQYRWGNIREGAAR